MSFSNNFSDTKEKLSDADHKKYTRVLKYLDRTLKRLSVDTRFEVYDQYVNHDRKVSDFYGFDIIHEEGRWNSLPEYTLYFNGKEALKVNGRGPDIEGKYEIELEKPLDTNAEKALEKLMKDPVKYFKSHEKKHPELEKHRRRSDARKTAEHARYRADLAD